MMCLHPAELNSQCTTSICAKDSGAMTDGGFRLRNAAGQVIFHILILEVKEGWGEGGGSHPLMQLISYYAMFLVDRVQNNTWAVWSTCLPVLAIELYGNNFR